MESERQLVHDITTAAYDWLWGHKKNFQERLSALIKKAGYVRLSDDQSRPTIHETGNYETDLENLHREYQLDGWWKIERPVSGNGG